MGTTSSSERMDEDISEEWRERAENTNGEQCSRADQISSLLSFAHDRYQQNPTEALSALMQAVTLNGNDTDAVMNRLRAELGDDVANHVGSNSSRRDRAVHVVRALLDDESTLLYQRGKQDILRQTMEDGTSVVCTRCNAVVASARWQPHREYWCPALPDTESDELVDDSMSDV